MHQAKIINAFHDGIFVSLPGYEVDGLVHHSQISRQLEMDNTLPKVERFKRIQEIVGDIDYEVWVKIVYVAKTEHLKCECSLKMVRLPSVTCLLFPSIYCPYRDTETNDGSSGSTDCSLIRRDLGTGHTTSCGCQMLLLLHNRHCASCHDHSARWQTAAL